MPDAAKIIKDWCASCGMPEPSDGECHALAVAISAAAPVVLPEPSHWLIEYRGEKTYMPASRFTASSFDTGSYTKLYTEQQVHALLATGGQAQAVKLLAADHSGMKVDYRGLFSQVQRALKRTDPGYAEMLRQLEGHLQELGQRWYAGDTDVVDEILQLYCIERDARKTVCVTETAAPQAQADARDADGMYYLQDARHSAMVGNCPSWWRPDGNGYTTNLDEAARFTFDEAMAQHRCRDTDLPWLCSEVDKLRRTTVDCQYMPRSWDAQRESIAAIAAAKGE